jgi:hypothetical protein
VKNAPFFKNAAHVLKQCIATTSFQWIKGHNGIQGNEESDGLAKEGANKPVPDSLNLDVPKEFDLQGARLVAVLRMSAFLGTIQNLNFRTAVVSFNQVSLTITYHPEQPSVVPPYFSFNIYDRNQIRAVLVASMVQICSANAPASCCRVP